MVSKSRMGSAYFIVGLIPILLAAQGAMEVGKITSASHLDWPAGPSSSTVPSWARNGRLRFARWDGGRIETAKAVLSGWSGFWPPDPDVLQATTDWYDPRTIRYLREADINMIWVTFSNGFSNQTEKLHQENLARYIAECHRQGIHVMAYESIANMFWEDMFKNVPESRSWPSIGKNGQPVPYGAAEYKKLRYVSRYMADLGNPQWLAYLRKRVDLAVDAGADGIMYDNNFSPDRSTLFNVYRMIYDYGSSRKKDFLLMGNFHHDTYVFDRLTNCMTTEDGLEPGIYDEAHTSFVADKADALAVDQGILVNNVGLFRVLDSLTQGWKPNLVEDGRREVADRLSVILSPARQKLELAEAKSFGLAEELYVEDALGTALWNEDPKATELWKAIGQYDHFFSRNEEYYVGTSSLALTAVVLDDASDGVGLLNALAARNVFFDVIYERDLTAPKLARYSCVVVATAKVVGDDALRVLESYVRNGGKLIVAGDAASFDRNGQTRTRPSFFGQNIGKGECTYFEKLPSADQLAGLLRTRQVAKDPAIDAAPGIIYNCLAQPDSRRLIVHLLNYRATPIENVKLVVPERFSRATLLSPDAPSALPLPIHDANGKFEVTIPKIDIYSMLVLAK